MFPNLFQPKRSMQSVPKPEPIYTQLRNRILHLSPSEIDVTPSSQFANVWGIVMEMGFPNGAFTLLCLAEQTRLHQQRPRH